MRGDRTKLPRWAQEEFDSLERQLRESEARYAAAVGVEDGEGPHYVYRSWFPILEPISLVPWARPEPAITFLDPAKQDLPRGRRGPKFQIRYNPKAERMQVMVDDLVVRPLSSNVIHITSEDR